MPMFEDDLLVMTPGIGTAVFQAHTKVTGDRIVEVLSSSQTGVGVSVTTIGAGVGVESTSNAGHGVHGVNGGGSAAPPRFGSGVWGESDNGYGLYGSSGTADGVGGVAQGSGRGVWGESRGNDGVQGRSHDPQHSGVAGINDAGGIGVFGAGATAGLFAGRVTVQGDLEVSGAVQGALGQRLQQLEQRLAVLETQRMTLRGQTITPPALRPTLSTTVTHGGRGPQTIVVQGHGFGDGLITLHIVRRSGGGVTEQDLPGHFPFQLGAANGEHVTLMATEGVFDANDLTSKLWSVAAEVDVG